MKPIDFPTFLLKYHALVDRGLSSGKGHRDGQMCIETVVCAALDLPHGDEPGCVAVSVRSYKIALNDAPWSSSQARAKGLRLLGIAQMGSLGVIDDRQFAQRLAKRTIQVLIPTLFRELFPDDLTLLDVAQCCEDEGTARAAAAADNDPDKYLKLSAKLALEILQELGSPGCAWLS